VIAMTMLYAMAAGGLVVLAALAVERLVHDRGGPTRFVWLAALAASALLPGWAVLSAGPTSPAERMAVLAAPAVAVDAVVLGHRALLPLDDLLIVGWIVASVVVGVMLAVGLGLTAWRRRAWQSIRLDGVPVLLSREVGPAVVGLLRSRIVLPDWVMAMSAPQREMMLRHEEEHLRAGDPRLVLLGALAIVALPWNLAVWFAVHRMRLAVEVDCDRRVLERGTLDRRGYAELLLAVGARRSAAVYGVGFSLGRPLLEERIERMTRPRGERRSAASLLVMLGALGVIGAAWSLPRPARVAMVFDGVVQSCSVDGVAVSRDLLKAYDWNT
jgi:hypothetical protein